MSDLLLTPDTRPADPARAIPSDLHDDRPSRRRRSSARPDGHLGGAVRVPGATYRFQFNHLFTFKDALKLVPYLDELGITDLYASPFLKAGPDSLHGYDVSNHNEINPAIGSEADYAELADALRERGMSQLLDVVPNHMGVGSNVNEWWNDVLENGPISAHAPYFDVDWAPLQPELRNKVLLPILGDQYGRVLENGELQLAFRDGAFFLQYYEHILPIAPSTYATILNVPCDRLAQVRPADDDGLVELQSILTAISHLPTHDEPSPEGIAEHNREKDVVKRRLNALVLADREILDEVELEVGRLNGRVGDSRSFDALDAILNAQAYRLSYWRVASEEINYRRFFDVNTLAALRIENPAVFDATHRLIFSLLRQEQAHGLRIDHPDGLLDPAEYFQRLQAEYQAQLATDSADSVDEPPGNGRSPRHQNPKPRTQNPSLYVVVEKILAKDEPLPEDWAVHGTTGYDFMTAVGGIFVDASQRRRFDDLYARFMGRRLDFQDLVYESKRRIMALSLASEINVLAWQLNILSERDRRFRDFTLYALRDALREVIACFPVYRTYITGKPVSERDRSQIEIATAWARRRNPAGEGSIFQFIRDVLLLDALDSEDQAGQELQLKFVQKVQQTTGPVTAKAVEDTAFYIYNRLVSLNEVGGEPETFGVSVPAFHRLNAERLQRWPHSLLSTSTHDTKRSEDVRSRISAISELPREWASALTRWSRLNRRHRQEVNGGTAPSRNDEYLLYQVLLGAWPFEELDADGRAAFTARIQEYMAKATKEAKVHTSWINPNEGYDTAIQQFVGAILDPKRSTPFLTDFARFQRTIAPVGAVNSLGQTLLKLTVPGVPDTYQGNELWDLSLVDPDNRRPVDYRLRKRLLGTLQRALDPQDPTPKNQNLARRLIDHWTDGRVKLFVTWQALRFRREHPELFQHGAYLPLSVAGPLEEHLIAFVRELDDDQIVVAAPRLVARLLQDGPDASQPGPLRFRAGVWDETALLLPDRPGKRYRNLFTGQVVETVAAQAGTVRGARSTLPLGTLLADFPVILLVRETP
ncbi:MAG TPA: malto-oligosyltrehalose synthase [Chloroflexota bacterium]|nr:malto-oligosyltrehalose synthase [Chloroflexota bacterium]